MASWMEAHVFRIVKGTPIQMVLEVKTQCTSPAVISGPLAETVWSAFFSTRLGAASLV